METRAIDVLEVAQVGVLTKYPQLNLSMHC